MGRQKARRLSPCLPPTIDDGIGDNDSRGDPLKGDGRYPDMAVRVTVNNKRKEHWALQRIISTPSSPLAWLLCAVGTEELIARITTSVTSPQQIHITHSSLNPNVITFTTFPSSINQQEHFDKHL